MHQTRHEAATRFPIPRKGTKYVARPLNNLKNSVTVVGAVRDMLKLARTAKEVEEMIKQKTLKINGREVKDLRESIILFNIFEAGKLYTLTLNKSGRFIFIDSPNTNERACKVINKRSFRGGKIQINLHDGSNLIEREKINVNDTLYLDLSGRVRRRVNFEEGKECLVLSGKYQGLKCTIKEIIENKARVKLNEEENSPILEKRNLLVI